MSPSIDRRLDIIRGNHPVGGVGDTSHPRVTRIRRLEELEDATGIRAPGPVVWVYGVGVVSAFATADSQHSCKVGTVVVTPVGNQANNTARRSGRSGYCWLGVRGQLNLGRRCGLRLDCLYRRISDSWTLGMPGREDVVIRSRNVPVGNPSTVSQTVPNKVRTAGGSIMGLTSNCHNLVIGESSCIGVTHAWSGMADEADAGDDSNRWWRRYDRRFWSRRCGWRYHSRLSGGCSWTGRILCGGDHGLGIDLDRCRYRISLWLGRVDCV